jgi:uncharacterized protein (DUF433 family)
MSITTTPKIQRVQKHPQGTGKMLSSSHNRRKQTFPGIVKTKGVCGGSACIVRTRIPVWSIIEWQQMGCSNAKILKIYPTLQTSDILSAELYYEQNTAEIEAAILENQEA